MMSENGLSLTLNFCVLSSERISSLYNNVTLHDIAGRRPQKEM